MMAVAPVALDLATLDLTQQSTVDFVVKVRDLCVGGRHNIENAVSANHAIRALCEEIIRDYADPATVPADVLEVAEAARPPVE